MKRRDLVKSLASIPLLGVFGYFSNRAYRIQDSKKQEKLDFVNSLDIGLSSSCYQIYPLFVQPLAAVSLPESRKKWNLRGSGYSWSHSTMNSQETAHYSYQLFKSIKRVPYHHADESNFFNGSSSPHDPENAE